MYEIFRTGDIILNLDKTNQCGYEGQSIFKFRIHITGTVLDAKGFVVDTDDLNKAAQAFAVGRWQGACEELAESIAAKVRELGSFNSVRVEIQPRDVGFVTYQWKNTDRDYPRIRMRDMTPIKRASRPKDYPTPSEESRPREESRLYVATRREPVAEPQRGC